MNRELPYVNAYGTVDISKATNVEEALRFSGLDWNVDSRPIFDDYGNPYPNYRANVRHDNDSLLGIVSNKYHIVQNYEAFEFVDNLVNDGFKFDRAGAFRDGKSIWVMGQLPEEKILGDNIANNVIFVNSHDGTSGVKVMMTPVRIICSNMMNYALREADRIWAVKHTGGISYRMEEAKSTLGLATKYMEALNKEAERLVKIKVTDAEVEAIFDRLFPVDSSTTARKINNIAIMKGDYMACYNAADLANFRGTIYGALQAMGDYVSHRAPARVTASFYENHWNKLINGETNLDNFYKAVR